MSDLNTEDLIAAVEELSLAAALNGRYVEFVDGVMSDASKNGEVFLTRIVELQEQGVKVETLLTAAVGLPGEAAEVTDLVKKIIFQGKPFNDEIKAKLVAELGDVFWYLAAACLALNIDFDTIMKQNIAKLESRYPGGKFSIDRSENRTGE
jgi:NTP pyrophosphatase (non-canonical NTP hydrolase)